MKKIVPFITLVMLFGFAEAQGISKKLADAVAGFEADDQLKSGMIGLYVVNQQDGSVVFDKNGALGMPVASSQKVLTSVASLDILGTGYRYSTTLSYTGKIENGNLLGNMYINGSGDPTLGSWRYNNTKDEVILNQWIAAVKMAGITNVNGSIIIDNNWGSYTVPGGWIWDDIGNYYGAGATALNWHENQYDLKLRSGSNTGDRVDIVATSPKLFNVNLVSEVLTGKTGSGDNGYIYLAPYSSTGYVRGTIPPNEKAFTISGSYADPANEMKNLFIDELHKQGVEVNGNAFPENDKNSAKKVDLIVHQSPPTDSINYWFLRKSINLYGEALAKTLGYVKKEEGTTEAGVDVIKTFWKEKGIDPRSINMKDGSGLSPQNRIAPQALVKVLQYARSQPYFASFYNDLPEFNGIKMKSGTIGGVKSFTGYVNGYTFAIVVNNYNGSTATVVSKMYKLLDILK